MSPLIARLLLAFFAALFAAGCSTSEEDRLFFQEGWRHPEQGADERLNRSGW